MAERRICVGAIAGAHGVKGLVTIRPFTADPDDVAAYGPVGDESGARRFDIRVTGHSRGLVIARLGGIGDRDAAEALKGVRLYVPRSALPAPGAEEYYHADLIGLRAADTAGRELGTVRAVHDFGAGDVLEIADGAGGSTMVPFTRRAVPEVDPAAGTITVDPPAMDEDEDEDEETGGAGAGTGGTGRE